MITRIRIEGEAPSSERLSHEFALVRSALVRLFEDYGVEVTPAHEIVECCAGDPDVSFDGNWKGRAVVHLDTQRGNDQLPDRNASNFTVNYDLTTGMTVTSS